MCATKESRLEVVRLLLSHGADVNERGRSGGPFHVTPLMLGATLGRVAIVAELIHAGAQVDAQDEEGFTALHHAAARGHRGVVESLIAARADVHARSAAGETPLMLASRPLFGEVGEGLGGDLGTVELLLRAGSDVSARSATGKTALSIAQEARLTDVIALLERR
jgi:ankyrin repeat protein